MIFVRSLQETERRELKHLARREVGRVSERIRMILLSSRGYTVPQITAIFACDEATVRTWIERFETGGVEGLRDRPRGGRPRKADAVAREIIRHAMEHGPAGHGYLFGYWTIVTLVGHLAHRCGLHLSRATVRRTLLSLEFRWRRPRHELPSDPEAASLMWQLCERRLHLPTAAVVLARDECDVHLLPVLRAMWLRCGQPVRSPTPGTNRKRTIFGALDLVTGHWLYQVYERKRSIAFLAFLEHLLRACPGRPLVLVLDNASIHKAKRAQAWLAEHPQVQLLYLPAAPQCGARSQLAEPAPLREGPMLIVLLEHEVPRVQAQCLLVGLERPPLAGVAALQQAAAGAGCGDCGARDGLRRRAGWTPG